MNELVAFVETNEPELIVYDVYFSEDRGPVYPAGWGALRPGLN